MYRLEDKQEGKIPEDRDRTRKERDVGGGTASAASSTFLGSCYAFK